MMTRRTFHRSLLAAALVLPMTLPAPTLAQTFPDKPLRLVVPYPAGGPNDMLARILTQQVGDALGQPIIVENRAGATGLIGTDHVAKASPDGYTWLLSASVHVIYPSLFNSVPFDPLQDFAPVTLLASAPLVMSVNPGVPAENVQELIALAQTSDIHYASSGNGSATHLAAEAFKQQAGINMQHITYKGSSPALNDTVAGHVQLIVDSVPTSKPFIESNRLRPLAVTSARRSVALPEVPTLAESGLPDYDLSTWYGLWAPAGTPEDVIAKVSNAVNEVLQSPAVAQRLAQLGIEPLGGSPEAFARFQADEAAKWAKLVQDSGARID